MKKMMMALGAMLMLSGAAYAQSYNTNGTMNQNGTGQNSTLTPQNNATTPNANNVKGYNNTGSTNRSINSTNTNQNPNMNNTNTNTNTLYKPGNTLRTDSGR